VGERPWGEDANRKYREEVWARREREAKERAAKQKQASGGGGSSGNGGC
jgi:hypothetical protein